MAYIKNESTLKKIFPKKIKNFPIKNFPKKRKIVPKKIKKIFGDDFPFFMGKFLIFWGKFSFILRTIFGDVFYFFGDDFLSFLIYASKN